MSAFFSDYENFRGTGVKNEKGQDLQTFLQEYNPYKYPTPSVTVDMLVFQEPRKFTSVSEGLKLLLIRRKNHPSIGFWACPGGFCNLKEDLLESAKRELEEETGVTGIPLQQVSAHGDWKRDPRTRVITVTFTALLPDTVRPKAADDAADAGMFSVSFMKESETVQGENRETVYQLSLEEPDQGVHLSARLLHTERVSGLLRMPHWELLNSDGLAADHGILIADTLLYLEDLLQKQNA